MGAELSPSERATLAAMWAFRARGERDTAAQYEALGGRLQASGADAAVIARVVAAAADEARHHDVCAEMAAQLQQSPMRASPAKVPRIAPHYLDGGARLAYEVVALFCVTESINATLLLRSWQQATDDATRAALHQLLADEVEHSRIGWGYLAQEPGWRDELAVGLPLMLAAATHDDDFLSASVPPVTSPALVAHGLLPQSALREVFLEAMHDVVLPGLELCGVATVEARRWLTTCTDRWRPPATP